MENVQCITVHIQAHLNFLQILIGNEIIHILWTKTSDLVILLYHIVN